MFAVIKVHQWDDEVHKLECLNTFPSAEEAAEFIEKRRNLAKCYKAERREYVSKFIESIELPVNPSRAEWGKFANKYFGSSFQDAFPPQLPPKSQLKHSSIKNSLFLMLMNADYAVEGFDPPKLSLEYEVLLSVEIKC